MEFDRLRESDLPVALGLSTQAGWNQVEADWRRLLDLWPETCMAGRVHGRLVATATLATYGDVGWIGMVLVDADHRRRGIGGAMLDGILELGRGRAVRVFGLDATDLGQPVYLRRGFQPAVPIIRWVRLRRSPAPKPASTTDATPHARPAVPAAEPVVDLHLDRRASGVHRRDLIAHLAREPGTRVLAHGAGTGRGFSILRPGRTAEHLGPVIADTVAAAESHLADAVACAGERNLVVDVPQGRLEVPLAKQGFSPARRLVRMQTVPFGRAGALLAGRGVYAAAGFELG